MHHHARRPRAPLIATRPRPQVPDAALSKAEALAYSEFPDEGQLPLYSSSLAAAQHRSGGGIMAAGHRPGSCLRNARRLSSPRQFGHRPMAGAVAGRWGLNTSGRAAAASDLAPQQASATRVGAMRPWLHHLPPSDSPPCAGIEKASGRRVSSKRSGSGEDIVQQMQKKMRMQDGGGGGPFGGGGLQAMSP